VSSIRPLEKNDLTGVARLYGRTAPLPSIGRVRFIRPFRFTSDHLRPSGTRVLVHAWDPEVAAALAPGQALLPRMEGTWWMGHLVEPFTSSKAPSPR